MSQNPRKCVCPCCNDEKNSTFLQSVWGELLFEELCRRGNFRRNYLFCNNCIDDAKITIFERASGQFTESLHMPQQPLQVDLVPEPRSPRTPPINPSYYTSFLDADKPQPCALQNVIQQNPAYLDQQPSSPQPLRPRPTSLLPIHERPVYSSLSDVSSGNRSTPPNPFIQQNVDPMLSEPFVRSDNASVGLRLANLNGSPPLRIGQRLANPNDSPPLRMGNPLSPVNYVQFADSTTPGMFEEPPYVPSPPDELEAWQMEQEEQKQSDKKEPTTDI